GFLQEGHAAFEHAVAEDAVVSVAGDVQHFEAGTGGGEARGEFTAAQARHHHVGDEQLNHSGVGGGDFQGLHAVGRVEHLIAARHEIFADEFANALFVFDEQNGFGAR